MSNSLRAILLLLSICCARIVVAQDISVADFRLEETDLTANSAGTRKIDSNGNTAALIKVETTEQGFVFDGGMMGVVDTVQHVGEIWVYVPHGIKRIEIHHGKFGSLPNRYYDFPIPVEAACTYVMKLKTPIFVRDTRHGWLELAYSPSSASVTIDGNVSPSRGDGKLPAMLSYGQHTYEISAEGYESQRGTFVMDSSTVSLRVDLVELPSLIQDSIVTIQDTVILHDSVLVAQENLLVGTVSPKKRANAYWRSMLLPGWGDKYVRENGRFGVLKTIGAYGLIGAGVGMHFYGKEQYAQYETMARDRYMGTATYTQEALDNKYTLANTCRKMTPMFIGAGVAVWLYDVIWVAVKGHKSHDTAMTLDFDPKANSSFLSYSITF